MTRIKIWKKYGGRKMSFEDIKETLNISTNLNKIVIHRLMKEEVIFIDRKKIEELDYV